MIVFSATHIPSGKVFVGSTRDSLESEWANLISQADDQSEGPFFDLLRQDGTEGFEVEEWAYADSAPELRLLTREARDELGAEMIKSSRTDGAKRGAESGLSLRAIMATIEEAAQEVDEALQRLDRRDRQYDVAASVSAPAQAFSQASVPTPDTPAIPVASGVQSATDNLMSVSNAVASRGSSDERWLATQVEKGMRQTQGRAGQAEMNAIIARIEERRKQSRKSAPKPADKKGRSTAADNAPLAAATIPKTDKPSTGRSQAQSRLPEGRASSSTKEKRIREAIERERVERDSRKKELAAAEADEMAAILARLDQRGKVAEKLKRRR